MTNILYYGDNLDILRKHINDESIDLIYLDPPFNSQATYNVLFKEPTGELSKSQIEAFSDFWHWDTETQKTFQYLTSSSRVPVALSKLISALHDFLGNNDMSAYLVMMAVRLVELHRVLKSTGSIYLHCDPTASHYLKLVLDAIFGKENFVNEIVWCYTGPRKSPKSFARKHDIILFYSKSSDYYFNEQRIAHKSGVHNTGQVFGSDEEGDIAIKEELEQRGKLLEDWWIDIWATERYRNELLGYPTQKPLALLKRIIEASSKEGDIVLDPFCGCGTAIDAAEFLKRRWIGIDITHLAINLIKRRMKDKYSHINIKVIGEPEDVKGAEELANQDKYQFEWWALSLVDARPINKMKKGSDKGGDGIIIINSPNEIISVIVQVKGGKHIKSGDIRDLKGTVESMKAQFGLFITLEEPTRDMKDEATKGGLVKVPLVSEEIPKIEIITIKELLEGKKPKVNYIPREQITFQKAEAVKEDKENKKKGQNKKL